MSEVRRYRFADDEPLDLAEKPFFRHDRASERRLLVARNIKSRSALRLSTSKCASVKRRRG